MKRLRVDINDIAIAMESSNDIEESVWYLDTETGKVINIFGSVFDNIEAEDEEAIKDYPEWMKEMVENAEAVLNDGGSIFVEIPKILSYESYEIMERFISGIEDQRIRNRLFGAIKGKGTFRRFKDTISEWPELEKQWYKYRDKVIKKEVLDWLESVGIEPENIRED